MLGEACKYSSSARLIFVQSSICPFGIAILILLAVWIVNDCVKAGLCEIIN